MAAGEERAWKAVDDNEFRKPPQRQNVRLQKQSSGVTWQTLLAGSRDLSWREVILDTKGKKRTFPPPPSLAEYGYQTQDVIFANFEGVWLLKGRRLSDKAQVLIKVVADQPIEDVKLRVREEYQTMQGLQNSGIILTPLAMITAGDAVCLVMEWIDGMVFGTALFRKTCSDLHAHLNLAIAFCSLLLYLHSVRIVHNDLCPFVFFYVPSNKTYPIRLCDFSRSFRFNSSKDRLRSEPPLMRLPYMAPEQTGRLGYAVDLRADLYSLGAMLFQHLTALVPVEGPGLLETVHNVLTARPPRANELELHVPFHYASLVAKLLEKQQDERYMSAWGLREDLRLCLQSLKEIGKVGYFPLGEYDKSMNYRAPTRLVGRLRDAANLDAAALGAADGPARVILVGGAPGTGKTSLLEELRVKAKESMLCGMGTGKDLVMLFNSLLQSIQGLPEEQRVGVKRSLRLRLAPHARLLATALSAYAPLVQPSSPDGPTVPLSDEYLHDALADLAAALSRPPRSRPLLLLLDDAESADALTCRTLAQVVRACTGVLIVCAFNEEDVGADHPIRALQAAMKEIRDVECTSQSLGPLSDADAAEMVRMCFDSPEDAVPIGAAVSRRTQGNPFFFSLVLRALYDDATIDFDRTKGKWRADVSSIGRAPLPASAAEFVASRISLLPTTLIQIMLACACLVPEPVSMALLCIVVNSPEGEVKQQVRQLCEMGYLLEKEGKPGSYAFRHSFVLRAVLLLFPAEKREQMHWKTGQALLAQGPAHQLAALMQLNRGAKHVTRADRKPLLALNLSVAGQARANLDLALSRSLLLAARSVAEAEGGWAQPESEVGMWEVAVALYEVELLAKRGASAAALRADLERHQRSQADKTYLCVVRLVALRELACAADLKEAASEALIALNEPLPWNVPLVHMDELTLLFNNRCTSLGTRPRLPVSMLLSARCLAALATSLAAQQVPGLAPQCARRLALMTLTHGLSPYAPLGLALTATELAMVGRFEDARQWAAAALALREDDNPSECGWVKAVTHRLYSNQLAWLHMPLRSALKAQATAFDAALAAGCRLTPCLIAAHSCIYNFLSAQPMPRLLADTAAARALCGTREPELQPHLTRISACFAALCSPHADPLKHELAPLPERALLNIPSLAAATVATEVIALQLTEHPREAIACAEKHANLLRQLPCHPLAPALAAAHALALCDLYNNSMPPERQAQIIVGVATRIAELEEWNAAATLNVYPLLLLVQAEQSASLLHQPTDAMRLFDELTTVACRLEPTLFAPLAFELAGRFYWRHGARSAAHSFLGKAHDLVMRSGATAKAALLTRRYPFLRGVGSARIANDTGHADIHTAVNVSHALAAEIGSVDRLMSRLMRLLLDGGNAERAFFVLTPNSAVGLEPPRVIASYTYGEASPSLVPRPVADAALSETVVAFCLRTKQALVVDHAFTDTRFAYDVHIGATRVKSILCVPALKGETLFGLLYLENNAYAGAFTEERVQLMHVVASQLAISLENTGMVAKITQVSEELRHKNDELKRVDETKDRFLSMISHELRTPLNGIIGTTSLMLDSHEQRSEEDESYLTTIQSCSHSLLALVNDLLDLSRIQAGKMAIHTKTFNLAEAMDSAIYVVAATAALKKLDIAYAVHGSVPLDIVTDPIRLQQIILNLLSNGVKFTDRGHVLISFNSAELLPDGRRELRFSVADTGIGISPENMRLLFNMFSQVDDSNARRFGGSGIGLFLCDRLLSLLGGRIWAESDGRSGTTFHVSVPVGVPAYTIPPPLYPALSGRKFALAVSFKHEILTMQQQLQSMGAETRVCTSAAALEAALDSVDAAVVDLAMPSAVALVSLRNKAWLPFATALEWTSLDRENRPNIAPLLKPLQHTKFLSHISNFMTGTLRPVSAMKIRRALRGINDSVGSLEVPRRASDNDNISSRRKEKITEERRLSDEKEKRSKHERRTSREKEKREAESKEKEREREKDKDKKDEKEREKDDAHVSASPPRRLKMQHSHSELLGHSLRQSPNHLRQSPNHRKEDKDKKEREKDRDEDEKEKKEHKEREKEREREKDKDKKDDKDKEKDKDKDKDKDKKEKEDDEERRLRRERKKDKKEKEREVRGAQINLSPRGQSLLPSYQGKKIATSASGPAALVARRTPLVLVVEDNTVNNKLLCQILVKSGHYIVKSAFDGAQALEALASESEPFDAILMDVQMPVMDGLKATAELRKRGYDLPVIAVSASLDAATTAECAAAGMDDFISKPITRAAVLSVLLKWVNRRAASSLGLGSSNGR